MIVTVYTSLDASSEAIYLWSSSRVILAKHTGAVQGLLLGITQAGNSPCSMPCATAVI